MLERNIPRPTKAATPEPGHGIQRRESLLTQAFHPFSRGDLRLRCYLKIGQAPTGLPWVSTSKIASSAAGE